MITPQLMGRAVRWRFWSQIPMKRLPTDLEILNRIYDGYYETFVKDKPSRSSKNYIPIDIDRLAEDLRVDAEIIFGRLYYHLDKKHGYKQEDGSVVHLFTLKIGDESECVHFPYLASVLAELRSESRKLLTATGIAIISLIVAAVSLLLSIAK